MILHEFLTTHRDAILTRAKQLLLKRAAPPPREVGLAIAKQAVEAHGGALHARNLPGKGCVFTVELPGIAVQPKIPGEQAP